MRATDFEFRYRVWFIMLIIGAGFACYGFDHVSAAVALGQLLSSSGLGVGSGRGKLHLAFAIATALVTAAAGMRTWGSAYLGREVVHDRVLRSERLVAGGPYRYCRNPLYFGNILGATGMGLMASRTGWFVLVAGMFLFALRLIGREEYALLEARGDTYRGYLAAVPRLWPALRPRLPAPVRHPTDQVTEAGPAGVTTPRWGQAWAGEAGFWIAALATFGYAVSLNLRLFFGIAGISSAFYALIWVVLKRQEQRGAS
jgi:protein-S-isoprenylcysteine O-methyltransferase Ste14